MAMTPTKLQHDTHRLADDYTIQDADKHKSIHMQELNKEESVTEGVKLNEDGALFREKYPSLTTSQSIWDAYTSLTMDIELDDDWVFETIREAYPYNWTGTPDGNPPVFVLRTAWVEATKAKKIRDCEHTYAWMTWFMNKREIAGSKDRFWYQLSLDEYIGGPDVAEMIIAAEPDLRHADPVRGIGMLNQSVINGETSAGFAKRWWNMHREALALAAETEAEMEAEIAEAKKQDQAKETNSKLPSPGEDEA